MMFPAQPQTYTVVAGEKTLVQAWWYDEANNVVVALVKEGHYLRTPMAVEETLAAKNNDDHLDTTEA